jgi:hypothetical protein
MLAVAEAVEEIVRQLVDPVVEVTVIVQMVAQVQLVQQTQAVEEVAVHIQVVPTQLVVKESL